MRLRTILLFVTIGGFAVAAALGITAVLAWSIGPPEERLITTWPNTVRGRQRPTNGQANDNPPRNTPQPERSGRIAARGARAKGWSDIPSEERKVLERHISENLYTDKADAAKAYWS